MDPKSPKCLLRDTSMTLTLLLVAVYNKNSRMLTIISQNKLHLLETVILMRKRKV